MNLKYIAILGVLSLASCSSDQKPQNTLTVSLSGYTSQIEPKIQTGSTQTTPEIVNVGAGETKDISLILIDGK